MITDAIVGTLRFILFQGMDFTVKVIDHLFMPAHIRARHYMCCKRHLHADDFGKQTVWS